MAIPPAKMAEFYTTYELDGEKYCLKSKKYTTDETHLLRKLLEIFQILPHEQISWIYRDLGCEHHLVPDGDLKKAPTIPALTPSGFNHWITLFVLAYPNEESERLQKIVETMPIDADGILVERKPERLPKQLSRHLLPSKGDRESMRLLDIALSEFRGLATSSQTSSKIPVVNAKTSHFPTNHHEDTYSRGFATSDDYLVKHSLRPDMSYHGQVRKTGLQAKRTPRRKEKVYVHNSRHNDCS